MEKLGIILLILLVLSIPLGLVLYILWKLISCFTRNSREPLEGKDQQRAPRNKQQRTTLAYRAGLLASITNKFLKRTTDMTFTISSKTMLRNIAIALLVLVVGMGSFFTVNQGDRAFVLRLGKVVNVAQPGVHFKALSLTRLKK